MAFIKGGPRRRWSRDDKLAAVATTFQPSVTVNSVTRRLVSNPRMLFTLRKQYRAALGCTAEAPAAIAFR